MGGPRRRDADRGARGDAAPGRRGVSGPGDGDWSPEVSEIHRRRELAAGMGGADKVARQHASGRLTARERIDRLADPGSFAEIGALTAVAGVPANFVTG